MNEYTLYFRMPEGFRILEGAQTAPNGYKWIGRGSRFDGTHEAGLIAESSLERPSMNHLKARLVFDD